MGKTTMINNRIITPRYTRYSIPPFASMSSLKASRISSTAFSPFSANISNFCDISVRLQPSPNLPTSQTNLQLDLRLQCLLLGLQISHFSCLVLSFPIMINTKEALSLMFLVRTQSKLEGWLVGSSVLVGDCLGDILPGKCVPASFVLVSV